MKKVKTTSCNKCPNSRSPAAVKGKRPTIKAVLRTPPELIARKIEKKVVMFENISLESKFAPNLNNDESKSTSSLINVPNQELNQLEAKPNVNLQEVYNPCGCKKQRQTCDKQSVIQKLSREMQLAINKQLPMNSAQESNNKFIQSNNSNKNPNNSNPINNSKKLTNEQVICNNKSNAQESTYSEPSINNQVSAKSETSINNQESTNSEPREPSINNQEIPTNDSCNEKLSNNVHENNNHINNSNASTQENIENTETVLSKKSEGIQSNLSLQARIKQYQRRSREFKDRANNQQQTCDKQTIQLFKLPKNSTQESNNKFIQSNGSCKKTNNSYSINNNQKLTNQEVIICNKKLNTQESTTSELSINNQESANSEPSINNQELPTNDSNNKELSNDVYENNNHINNNENNNHINNSNVSAQEKIKNMETVLSKNSEGIQSNPSQGALLLKQKAKDLVELQARRKIMEEQNQKRKELISRVLEDRAKKTPDESQKLNEIKQELKMLDVGFYKDVEILRHLIEMASLEYMEAEKKYNKIEKEFLATKIYLDESWVRKQLLTEKLCSVIEENEERKAAKLQLEDLPQEETDNTTGS